MHTSLGVLSQNTRPKCRASFSFEFVTQERCRLIAEGPEEGKKRLSP